MGDSGVTALVEVVKFIADYGSLGVLVGVLYLFQKKIIRWGWEFDEQDKDHADQVTLITTSCNTRETELKDRVKEIEDFWRNFQKSRDEEWKIRLEQERNEGLKFRDMAIELLSVAKKATSNSEQLTTLARNAGSGE